MTAGVRVLRRMPVRRVVAAVRPAAFLAGAQMDPLPPIFTHSSQTRSLACFTDGMACDVRTAAVGYHGISFYSLKHLVHERDRDRPSADRRRHALDVAAAHVADREDARAGWFRAGAAAAASGHSRRREVLAARDPGRS